MTVSIHTPSGYVNTFPRNINPHAQWLSHYIRPVAIKIQSLKFKLIRPVAISIHTPSGNFNTVLEI